MRIHELKALSRAETLPKEEQLAWQLALLSSYQAPISDDVVEAAIDRIIDNAAVAGAAINRRPVVTARSQALAHPRPGGATVFGLPNSQLFDAEWAAWANSTAVRELDMNDTFLGVEYAHPSDNIPPILAVAQQCKRNGFQLLHGILSAYEAHISLARSICLHEFKKDHIAHLCPATVVGIGALLELNTETIYQAVQQAVHVSFTTRQSRKGEISSWKAFAPAHSAKLAIEAVDRSLRGETSPSPIYEGEEGVIAFMLSGPGKLYKVSLPEEDDQRLAILESFPKEYSAEYQAQVLIDLAFRMRDKILDFGSIEEIIIYTSHHTHNVIGAGSGDPQKYDPAASRETLDHSAMYIFAVALQDGCWHHEASYSSERASRPDTVRLWQRIRTVEDPAWTERYHEIDLMKRAYGAKVEIWLHNGQKIEDELPVAEAHFSGGRPFSRKDYVGKLTALTEGIISDHERLRFLNLVERLPELKAAELPGLNLQTEPGILEIGRKGIF